jgi:hypothetical protein
MARREREDPYLPPGPARDLVDLFKGLRVTNGEKTLGQLSLATGLSSRGHINAVLRGTRAPSPEAAGKLATALGADSATAERACHLAVQIADGREKIRREGHLGAIATALIRAWDALEPGIARQALPPGSPVRQAVAIAAARAIVTYATQEGRLDIAGPLLTAPALIAEPAVAAEFATVLAGRGTPGAALAGRRWRAAVTGPLHTRDFTVEAAALLEAFGTQVNGSELGPWLRETGEAAGEGRGRPLAASLTTARQELADITRLADRVSTGELSPLLRGYLRDQTSLIAEHTREFVGREFVADRIREVIEAADAAYCHILAYPGVGKTALMAELIRAGNYVHHFNVRTSGVVSPRMFLGNACTRLIAKYQLGDAALPDRAFTDGGYLYELLDRAAASRRGEKIVIAVDGLDESDTRELLPGTNPLYLPAELPSGVIVLVTSRPAGQPAGTDEWLPWKIRAGCAQVVIPIRHLGDENMADIARYLRRWAGRPDIVEYKRRYGYDDGAFVTQLARLSEGNFMYLHYMLPAIASGELRDRELPDLPLGLHAYYSDHLARMRDEDDRLWYDYRLPVIGAFKLVRDRPLTAAEIALISDIGNVAAVKDTLRQWSAFVVPETVLEDGVPRTAYRIYHSSFAEFLRDLAA